MKTNFAIKEKSGGTSDIITALSGGLGDLPVSRPLQKLKDAYYFVSEDESCIMLATRYDIENGYKHVNRLCDFDEYLIEAKGVMSEKVLIENTISDLKADVKKANDLARKYKNEFSNQQGRINDLTCRLHKLYERRSEDEDKINKLESKLSLMYIFLALVLIFNIIAYVV